MVSILYHFISVNTFIKINMELKIDPKNNDDVGIINIQIIVINERNK